MTAVNLINFYSLVKVCCLKIKSHLIFKQINGADGGTWTLTILKSTDFKSVLSAYSNTSAYFLNYGWGIRNWTWIVGVKVLCLTFRRYPNKIGSPDRTRTYNLLINSQPIYLLSYRRMEDSIRFELMERLHALRFSKPVL